MKIYTKKGDQGQTSLYGGAKLDKSHLRIHSYGEVDELNSYLGLLKNYSPEKEIIRDLENLQQELFTIGAHLAADPEKNNLKLPAFNQSLIGYLEKRIDAMEEQLSPLKSFILPGGNERVSHAHIARCICRRTERSVVALDRKTSVDPYILTLLNRLSDYLFVTARYMAHLDGVKETPWLPDK